MKFDLSYLNEVSGGDKGFIRDILNLFLEHSNSDVEAMVNAVNNADWPGASSMAHKIKSSVTMLGNQDAIRLIAVIEEESRKGNPSGLVEKATEEIKPIIEGMISSVEIYIATEK